MLTATEYRKRNRKTITLPSGGEVEIRKLSVADFLKVGDIPSAFVSGDEKERERSVTEGSPFARNFLKICLTCGVVSMRVVDKPAYDCGPDEVAVEEIPTADASFIASAVAEFTNLAGGAGEGIARFPEEQGTASND